MKQNGQRASACQTTQMLPRISSNCVRDQAIIGPWTPPEHRESAGMVSLSRDSARMLAPFRSAQWAC